MNVIVSEDGTTNVNIHRSKLGSALMVGNNGTAAAAVLAAAGGLAGNTDTLELDPNGTAANVFAAAAFTRLWKI